MFISTKQPKKTIKFHKGFFIVIHPKIDQSLVPFATAWMGENHFTTTPVAVYGVVLLMAGIGYYVLCRALIARHGPDSTLARAVGLDWKGLASLATYAVAIGLAFVTRWIAVALYALVAVMWLIPDRRIERMLGD